MHLSVLLAPQGAYGIGADGDAEGLGVTYGRRGGLVPVGQ